MACACRIAKRSQPPTRNAGSGPTRLSGSHRDISISHLRAPVSRLTFLQQIEVHVFYVALGYFISCLPFALLAEALSSGIVPGVDRSVWGLVTRAEPGRQARHCTTVDHPAVSPDDQRHAAALIQQTVQKLLAERFL